MPVPDALFVEFAWRSGALAADQVLKLKERQAGFAADGREKSLHELALDMSLLPPQAQEELALFVGRRAIGLGPAPAPVARGLEVQLPASGPPPSGPSSPPPVSAPPAPTPGPTEPVFSSEEAAPKTPSSPTADPSPRTAPVDPPLLGTAPTAPPPAPAASVVNAEAAELERQRLALECERAQLERERRDREARPGDAARRPRARRTSTRFAVDERSLAARPSRGALFGVAALVFGLAAVIAIVLAERPAVVDVEAERQREAERALRERAGDRTERMAQAERDARRERQRELEREREAGCEDALRRATRAEERGDFRAALDALDEAEARGVARSVIDARRMVVRARRTEHAEKENTASAVGRALERAEELARAGKLDEAVAAARAVLGPAAQAGLEVEARAVVAKLEAAQAEATAQALALPLIAEAVRYLDRNDLETARALLDRARERAPRAPGIDALERRLQRALAAPEGMVYVEVDAPSDLGVYARRAAATNGDLRRWISNLPSDRRPAAPTGPAELPACVRQEQAAAFAAFLGDRLPTAAERAAIRRQLGAPEREGEATVLGGFEFGFRSVRDLDTARPPSPPQTGPPSPAATNPKLEARVRDWLRARTAFLCGRCSGHTRVRCGGCSGRGSVSTTVINTDGTTNVIWRGCGRCAGAGAVRCPECKDGTSEEKTKLAREWFGLAGSVIAGFDEKSIASTVDRDGKLAEVTYGVRIPGAAAPAGRETSERSEWRQDADGRWRVTSILPE